MYSAKMQLQTPLCYCYMFYTIFTTWFLKTNHKLHIVSELDPPPKEKFWLCVCLSMCFRIVCAETFLHAISEVANSLICRQHRVSSSLIPLITMSRDTSCLIGYYSQQEAYRIRRVLLHWQIKDQPAAPSE